MLESFGFILPDEQFSRLCEQLSFTNGYMNYNDFVRAFENRRPWTPTADGENQRPSNHHVNEIRGDEVGMSCEELETKLRQKMEENFNVGFVFFHFWLLA
jgi:hypothetical protein